MFGYFVTTLLLFLNAGLLSGSSLKEGRWADVRYSMFSSKNGHVAKMLLHLSIMFFK